MRATKCSAGCRAQKAEHAVLIIRHCTYKKTAKCFIRCIARTVHTAYNCSQSPTLDIPNISTVLSPETKLDMLVSCNTQTILTRFCKDRDINKIYMPFEYCLPYHWIHDVPEQYVPFSNIFGGNGAGNPTKPVGDKSNTKATSSDPAKRITKTIEEETQEEETQVRRFGFGYGWWHCW